MAIQLENFFSLQHNTECSFTSGEGVLIIYTYHIL